MGHDATVTFIGDVPRENKTGRYHQAQGLVHLSRFKLTVFTLSLGMLMSSQHAGSAGTSHLQMYLEWMRHLFSSLRAQTSSHEPWHQSEENKLDYHLPSSSNPCVTARLSGGQDISQGSEPTRRRDQRSRGLGSSSGERAIPKNERRSTKE